MRLKRLQRTDVNLREFYEGLRDAAPQWNRCATAMLALIEFLEAAAPDDEFGVFTSLEVLVFGNPETSERNVLVTAEVDGLYRVEYALAESELPWQVVVGKSYNVAEVVRMLQFALRSFGHRLPESTLAGSSSVVIRQGIDLGNE